MEPTLTGILDDSIVALVPKFSFMMLTGGSGEDRVYKPTTGPTVKAVAILADDWDPSATGNAIISDVDGTITYERKIAMYELHKLNEYPFTIKTGGTAVVPGDDIMPEADGEADKGVVGGGSNIACGLVVKGAGAGETGYAIPYQVGKTIA